MLLGTSHDHYLDNFRNSSPGLLSLLFCLNSIIISSATSNKPSILMEGLYLVLSLFVMPYSWVDKLPKLTGLSLFGNSITNVGTEVPLFKTLIAFKMANNRISNLGSFPKLTYLEELSFGDSDDFSNVKSCGSIDASLPGKVPALKKLYLTRKTVDLYSFSRFYNVEYLDIHRAYPILHYSIPTSLETKLPALVEVNGGYNYVNTIHNFPSFPNLEIPRTQTWGCDRSRFTSMPASFLSNSPKLKELYASGQGLDSNPCAILFQSPWTCLVFQCQR